LKKIVIPFYLYGRPVALRDIYFGGSADIYILKITDAAFFRPDLSVPSYSFTEEMTTRAQYHRQGQDDP